MNKIACDVCLDLIPLVKDNVASEASKLLVQEHINTCKECKRLYDSFDNKEIVMDEKIVLNKMKKQIFITLLSIIFIASMVGLGLSESMGMFYNVLIMPGIGILGYFALKEKSYLVLVGLFFFSYIWLLVKYIGEGMMGQGFLSIITLPILWSMIYAGLCGLGILIGFLLNYAFGKENSYEK